MTRVHSDAEGVSVPTAQIDKLAVVLDEPILDDDYPVYADYLYVADGRVVRSPCHGVEVRHLKRAIGATEIRRCDIFGRREQAAAEKARTANAVGTTPPRRPRLSTLKSPSKRDGQGEPQMASTTQHRSRDAQGRRVIHEGLEALMVFGGFQIATAEWTRTEDGWDCDYEVVRPTVYPTKEACEVAIEAIRAETSDLAVAA